MKNSLEQKLKQIDQPIFFVTNDPERALGLETYLPNFHIVCIDNTTLTQQLAQETDKLFCLEKHLNKKNPIFRNSNRLLKRKEVQNYILKNTPTNKTPHIQVFKIAPNIERTCEKLGYKLLNPNSKLNRKFENKIPQFKTLGKLGLFPKTKLIKLKDYSYEQLQEKIGTNLVLQYNRGHTGKSTIFLKSPTQYKSIQNKFPKRTVRVSKRIEGDAWTLNACQTRYGCFYGGLSYQITGVPVCTSQKGGTVGNDWSMSDKLSQKTLNQIHEMTQKIGNELSKHSYRGLFGLDLIIDNNGKVWLIEINARQPASTSMHSQILLNGDILPLNLFHILEFLHPDRDYLKELKLIPEDITTHKFHKEYNAKALQSFNAAQLFIRNTESKKIKLKASIKSGIYDFELQHQENQYRIDNSQTQLPLIFSFNKGHIIKPNQEIARIQINANIVDKKGILYNKYLKLAKLIKNRIFQNG